MVKPAEGGGSTATGIGSDHGVMAAVADIGERLSRFTQRWIPDSWVVCMAVTVIAMLLAVAGAGAGVNDVVLAWGGGMWGLLELAMQFTIALVAAHACVSSPFMYAALDRLAALPDRNRPRQAVALVGVFSLITGYLNWALCLAGSALLVPFVCRRNPNTDVRVLVASAYLGIGTVWHGGLSGSAPLIMATPGNPLVAPRVGQPVIDSVIPVSATLFSPFNLWYVLAIGVLALVTIIALHPRRNVVTLDAERLARMVPEPPAPAAVSSTPAQWMESFRGWTWLAAALIAYPVIQAIVTRGFGAAWTINAYNAVFLVVALLLHGRPSNLVRAMAQGASSASGIILQFPFYAGIFGVINNTGLGAWLGEWFVAIGTRQTFALIVFAYSGVLDLFVPSGGSKWLIEAPYLLPAAATLGVSAPTTVLAYAYGSSNVNLIQPFWAIPILAVTGLRFGDIVGYTALVALACLALNIVAMLLIPATL